MSFAMLVAITLSAERSGFCGDTWNTTPYDPKSKENVKWRLSDDGILTIWGKGMTMDCTISTGSFGEITDPIHAMPSVSVTVIFEDSVYAIGPYFFAEIDHGMRDKYDISQMSSSGRYDPRIRDNPGNITSVKFNCTCDGFSIGQMAFFGCTGLSEIDFDVPLEFHIGSRAFGWTSIKKMFIPDNVILKPSSLVRCPLEQVIVTNPIPSTKKAYIGQYKPSNANRDEYYRDPDAKVITDVFVPDVGAYSAWEPTPKPMLKEGHFSIEDAALGNILIASNIPDYVATTDYQFDQLTEGQHTVVIPVKFTGEKNFETNVKYTYTIGDGSSSIDNIANDKLLAVKVIDGMVVVSGNAGNILIFNITGQKVYDGNENQIPLSPGIYLVSSGGQTIKVKL